MKKRILSMLFFTAFSIMLISSAAQASISANILYNETNLGNGSWQYDYMFQNTSSSDETHGYLQKVMLAFDESTVNVSGMPANWTSYTFTGTASIGVPVVTGYLEMYSDTQGADVAIGSTLGGFRFTTDYRIGNIAYEAVFSDHGAGTGYEDFASTTGTTTPTPIPAAVWLLGSGLAGIAGLRRRIG